MTEPTKTIIIGGVAGGATAAARLRRLDEQAEIILLERGAYISYANCGLPYYIGGVITDKKALTLQTPASFKARFKIDVRINQEATAIDRAQKSLTILNRATNESYTEHYDNLILATGATPFVPPVSGLDSERVFSLRNIPDTYRLKEYLATHQAKTAAILGGGAIGLEMAENLTKAGLKVTIIDVMDQVITPLDYDMACEVAQHLEASGVQLLLGRQLQAVAEIDSGLWISLDEGGLSADLLLLAAGIRPESKLARECGLALNTRGAVMVDSMMRTSDPAIYAVGDVVETTEFVSGENANIPLAGPANKQGRIAAGNIAGQAQSYRGTQGSSILQVFDLTVASTGLNEKTAQKLGLDYDKSFTYSGSHAGYYPGATNMTIKTIYEKTSGRILGAQVVGKEGVDKRCDVLATAIHFRASAADLAELELCYAPPYSSAKDPVNMAGYVIENVRQGLVEHIHWHDLAALPQDGSVDCIDVRTEAEFARGNLAGFRNIPLDELRSRLAELDPQRKIYVTCQIGLRGYLACRILSQHGFRCANLNGGYRLAHAVLSRRQAATPPRSKPLPAATPQPGSQAAEQ